MRIGDFTVFLISMKFFFSFQLAVYRFCSARKFKSLRIYRRAVKICYNQAKFSKEKI